MATRRKVSWLHLYVGAVLVFLFAPIVVVVLFSFNSSASLSFPFSGLSLRWYQDVLSSAAVGQAVLSSLRVAAITVVVTLVFGTLAAVALTRQRFRGRNSVRAALIIPAALPPLFLGIALLSFFVQAHISLSLWTVTLGHIIFTLPYLFLVASARLTRFDPYLEESARDLGAGWLTAFRRVVLPVIAPALIAGALVVFMLSWDEVLITLFTIGNENTFPLLIFSAIRTSLDPSINAVSTLLLAGSLVFVGLVSRYVVDVTP